MGQEELMMSRNNGRKPGARTPSAKKMTLTEWRGRPLKELTLPSGLTVKLRDLTITDLAFMGKLPQSVLDLAAEAEAKGEKKIDLKAALATLGDLRAMLDAVTEVCLIEPPLADEPDDMHIALRELSADDKMAIFNFVNGEVEDLRPFREGEDEPAAAALAGGSVRNKAKRNRGAEERTDGLSAGRSLLDSGKATGEGDVGG